MSIDLDQKLSAHFTLRELCRTSIGLPNIPGGFVVGNLTILCVKILEPLRAHFGRPVTVNSAFRSRAVNQAVGSTSKSQHPLGQAADVEIDGISNPIVAAWIRDNLPFDQLILENYRPGITNSGWVHVSYRSAGQRRQCLTMTMGSHGPVYTPGLNA